MSDKHQKNKLDCWKSFFHCCYKEAIINNENFEDNSCKYDYIVEKLVIKRVPLNVFSTQYHSIYKVEETPNILNDTTFCSKNDKVQFQTLETSASLKSDLQNLHNQVSPLNSQFSKISSEVPFKENGSEVSDVQIVISNTKETIDNEYTSNSVFASRNYPCCHRENASCPIFNQRNLKAHSENIEMKRHLQRIKQPKHRPKTPERLRKIRPNTDFVMTPVEVHYESPNLHSMRKHYKKFEPTILNHQTPLDGIIFGKKSSHYKSKFPAEESSTKSETDGVDEAAETTLRWKIIIKNHQSNVSENKNQDSKLTSVTDKEYT